MLKSVRQRAGIRNIYINSLRIENSKAVAILYKKVAPAKLQVRHFC